MGGMVLFRDRFRLVAPSSGTKFAHALIKYRLSQMSLHRIHHPPQKAVHDVRKAPLSPPRPKPIGALWLVLQLFPKPACFPLASGWGISSITSILGATFTFLLALLLLDSCSSFPAWSNFPFLLALLLLDSCCSFPTWSNLPFSACFAHISSYLICSSLASGWGISPILKFSPQNKKRATRK